MAAELLNLGSRIQLMAVSDEKMSTITVNIDEWHILCEIQICQRVGHICVHLGMKPDVLLENINNLIAKGLVGISQTLPTLTTIAPKEYMKAAPKRISTAI